MIRTLRSLVVVSGLLAGACADDNDDPGTGPAGGLDASVDGAAPGPNLDASLDGGPRLGFFVTSTTSKTANLGGLAAADTRCQTLAAAAGQGERVWHAFLSVEHDATKDGGATSAFDRIGAGPWYNSKQALVAADRQDLTLRFGDPALFLDEKGNRINGQWIGSPTPNEHDILTGTLLDGGVAFGKTCGDWVIDSVDGGSVAVVGHSDGLGPNQDSTSPRNSWFSAHDNESCGNTTPRGGAGRIYCFAAD
ncbi:MAG TPA: hypothetical protein VFX59_16515 [Polyangiales bacterium]|nr:hypothetical protein [Polyangiales bacterium]